METGSDYNQIANLLRMNIVPAKAGEPEMARFHDLHFADGAVLAPQGSRVRAVDLVFEVADRPGFWIALEQLHLVHLSVAGNGHDAALREGQRVIVNLQSAQSDIGAAGNGDRPRRLRADHLCVGWITFARPTSMPWPPAVWWQWTARVILAPGFSNA